MAETTKNKAKTKERADAIGPYDFKNVEESVLEFWKNNKIWEKVKETNKGKQKFFFIQGPPYTSGRIHLGQAWNNSLKDMVLRYKRMRGLDVFDRAAYDMHGLPTEHKVMALHNFTRKEEIDKYGVEKFVNECIEFSKEKAELMSQDLKRLGIWMDFENARLPIDNSYIEGIWFLIKKAHEKNRLYEGLRTMSWCASCATAMAKHECEYKEIKENSIFVKFPVKGKEKEFLVVWTTTPWTITYNLAVMVNPELDYVKAKVGDEVWILAKGLAAPVVQNFTSFTLEVLDEFKGTELEGLEYVHPWNDKWDHYKEIKTKHPKAHTVILSEEFVDLSAGTGLVHCAPGCGPEDYEVGYKNNIPAFNNLKEDGTFPEEMGEFAGLKAKTDDKKFVEALEKSGVLIATTEVEHDYAHCQRCHNPVVFRTTKQWFFKIEDLKDRIIEANENVNWVPVEAKNAFRSWLQNLRDNSITKQRVWGTPAPIWKCESCGKYEVIGSMLELKEKAGHCPPNLHKPWIDDVKINCSCGAMMKRIPDILDVWIDAGTLSWNILDYPQDKELYQRLYPADFILEGKDQIRGWFNLLMITSFLALDRPSFKNCYMHGFVTDVEGEKMSKSLGNVLSPYAIVDKFGADTLRYYMCGAAAGEDINFSWEETELRHRNLTVLWNLHKYVIEFYRQNEFEKIESKEDITRLEGLMRNEEKYMMSKTFSTVKKVTNLFEAYRIDMVPALMEELFLELSRTYIQMTREAAAGTDDEKQVVFYTMYVGLLNCIKMFSTLAPMISEQMYQNLKLALGLKQKSITMYDWPTADTAYINEDMEKKFDIIKNIIQTILSVREKAQLGVRWPIGNVVLVTENKDIKAAAEALVEILQRQTNIKKLSIVDKLDEVTLSVKADYAKLGPAFGNKAPKIIAQITINSPESIYRRIEADGKFRLHIDNETFEITREHLIVKREVPEPYLEGEFRGGFVYLDKTRTPELEAEGFARETMRRIQSMRKDAGLQKSDDISLYIEADPQMAEMLRKWKQQIMDKVGAVSGAIQEIKPERKYSQSKEEKIKDKKIVIHFDKLG